MRVKFKTGNSFVQTVAYVLGATKDQKPKLLMSCGLELNLMEGFRINKGKLSRKKIYQISRYIAKSFEIQALVHPLNKPVRHYIMTFPPDDREILEDSSQLTRIIQEYMEKQDMLNTQYLVVRHNNTDHPHVHIVYNPINNNLEVINESKQFKKNERLCKQLTRKYGLHFSNPREYKVEDYKKIAKHERNKAYVRCSIEEVLRSATSISEFAEMLEGKHIVLRAKFIDKDGKPHLQGLLFHYRISGKTTLHFKASQLSRSLTPKVIIETLKQNQNKAKVCGEGKAMEPVPEKTSAVSIQNAHQQQSPKDIDKSTKKANPNVLKLKM